MLELFFGYLMLLFGFSGDSRMSSFVLVLSWQQHVAGNLLRDEKSLWFYYPLVLFPQVQGL